MRTARPLIAVFVVAAAFGVVALTLAPSRAGARQPWSASQKTSYAVGHMLGAEARFGLERDGVDIDVSLVVQGFADALKKSEPALSDSEIQATLADLHRVVQERRSDERLKSDSVYRAIAEDNVRRGRETVEKLSKKEGARQLENGVWALPLRKGDGASPKPTDTVVLTYVGTTADGKEFSRGVASEIRVDQMLPGGQVTLPKMRVGDRWLVAVPHDMAYGAAGRDPDIGPNETLLFDVELVSIK